MTTKMHDDVIDGHIEADNDAGANPINKNLTVAQVVKPTNVPGDTTRWCRAYLTWTWKTWPPWPLKLPTSAVISRIDVRLYVNPSTIGVSSPPADNDVNCVKLTTNPWNNNAGQIWGDIGAGTIYQRLTDYNTSGWHSLAFTSGSDAVITLQARLDAIEAAGGAGTLWFGLGFKFLTANLNANIHRLDIATEEGGTGSAATCQLTY